MTMDPKQRIPEGIEAAARVAAEGSAALDRLAGTVRSDPFARLVEAALDCTGRIAVIGLGKSGIVAQKTAATLTSTGTPAFYLHAADALHGDMGAVRPDDLALLISKSGETHELLQLIPYLKEQGNRIAALTNDPDSRLAREADPVLLLGVESEGCPLNLAPMTSTTATMALGDALAAALIVARDFRPESFARFHPGGKLGWMLTATVGDMIDPDRNPVCRLDAPLREGVVALMEYRLGGVNVVDGEGRLAGILTDGDLKRILAGGEDGMLDHPVCDAMTPDPVTVTRETMAARALDLMENRESQISVLPVVDDEGRPVGMVRIHDVIRSGY